MPVTSSVQTPELFKGRLKEYQLKGLQWLVNCYEQVSFVMCLSFFWLLFYACRFSLVVFFLIWKAVLRGGWGLRMLLTCIGK